MKTRITHLSPHQNGKVVGIVSAIVSLIFFAPLSLLFSLVGPGQGVEQNPFGSPIMGLVFFPLAYLIAGYLSTVVFCALYNRLIGIIGGFEFEAYAE